MKITVKLSKKIVSAVKSASKISGRSIVEQIEIWIKIGKVVEENPDLTYNFIKNILTSLEEAKAGKLEKYPVGE